MIFLISSAQQHLAKIEAGEVFSISVICASLPVFRDWPRLRAVHDSACNIAVDGG
jgi:hypothetical protein